MATSRIFERAFVKRFSTKSVPDVFGEHKHNPKSAALWTKVFFFVCVPALIVSGIRCYPVIMEEPHEHGPEFIPYDHLRIRKKPFPWGDGQHTLFHNPKKNALPTGYEE